MNRLNRSDVNESIVEEQSPTPSGSAQSNVTIFPPAEILDIGLDLYIRHFYPLVPLLHIPTFTPQSMQPTILLVMCLIGLQVLNTDASTAFVLQLFPVSIRLKKRRVKVNKADNCIECSREAHDRSDINYARTRDSNYDIYIFCVVIFIS